MKTILALVFSVLLVNTFSARLRQFLGDQSACQKGVGVQAGLGIGACQSLGVSQCDKGIGIGASQCGIGKGVGIQASPFNWGGYGWSGNSYPWGYGNNFGYPRVGYGIGYPRVGYGCGLGSGYGVGKGIGYGACQSVGYKGATK